MRAVSFVWAAFGQRVPPNPAHGEAVLTFGSLFAGIGGFDLGLERAGMRCLWQCEIDPYCQRVLAKHWPDVLRVPDIRELRAGTVPRVAVLAGGFPCQPVSDAGAQRAQDDERWLWPEFARVVGELRPRYVIVENVRGLFGRGLDIVLGDLAALRYDAEWGRISAADVGAPHGRSRVWIVAYSNADGRGLEVELQRDSDAPQAAANGHSSRGDADGLRAAVPDTADGLRDARQGSGPRVFGAGWWSDVGQRAQWEAEPDVGRMADGISARLDNARLNGLGNALVPQIAEWIGRRIVEFEEGRVAA